MYLLALKGKTNKIEFFFSGRTTERGGLNPLNQYMYFFFIKGKKELKKITPNKYEPLSSKGEGGGRLSGH